jgi:ribosomal protein L11 methyltransferase
VLETWWRLKLWIIPCLEDVFVFFFSEHGIQGVQVEEEGNLLCLVVYQPQEHSFKFLESELKAYAQRLENIHGYPVLFGWHVDLMVGEDWQKAWKAFFHVTRISPRFTVKPSWEPCVPTEGVHVLEIDPGQAFGTGLHATTRMCLEYIDRFVDKRTGWVPSRALDVGTGTGILAIALAKLGVKEVVALDTDPLAVEAAKSNVRNNGVDRFVAVHEGSMDKAPDGPYDLVVANLTGPKCQALSDLFAKCLRPQGLLLISGFLGEERAAVLDAFHRTGLGVCEESLSEDWCALVMNMEA